ncbi:hypothetical protein Zmor_011680 [Zophobas morio]|uniref:PHD-type domain-containing protein n=1 Tax=Zophobas morio TaxID=2755281 RepID=A0AA38ML41_9CUCU|nr:hypothetical protein Zmor_011680 [Zophobas morio]
MSCLKCGTNIQESIPKSYVKCDGCSRPIHATCSELTAADLKCLELRSNTKRRIKYICIECEQGLHQIPKIMSLLTELKNEITQLKEANANPINVVATNNLLSSQAMEEIVNEISERDKRANNLIIFNSMESGISKQEQVDQDTTLVSDIISIVGLTEEVKPVRLGKFDGSKQHRSRPIRVRLSSSNAVHTVIRNAKKIRAVETFSALSVSFDRTPRELNFYKSVKEELNTRRLNGETNLQIKYRNGIPAIVSVPINGAKNNNTITVN